MSYAEKQGHRELIAVLTNMNKNLERISNIDQKTTVVSTAIVHAKWEKVEHSLLYMDRCSACGELQILCEINSPNYCPNCGAKMDLEW